MIKRLSEALGVSSSALDAAGVFDAFLEIDSQFHVDPALLKSTTVPELSDSYTKFQKFFQAVFLLAKSANTNPEIARRGKKLLEFEEIDIAGLGFTKNSKHGRAWGPKLAGNVFGTATALVQVGIVDSEVFELLGLFEENIGADLISDMTLAVILPDIITFNQRVIRELGLPTVESKTGKERINLAADQINRSPVLLLPRSILSPMPCAESWSEIDQVTEYNEELRNRLNQMVGITWKDATKRLHKRELRRILLNDPSLFRELIGKYRGKPAMPYDFANDPLGAFLWAQEGKEAASLHPLNVDRPKSHEDVSRVVGLICGQFKRLVEHNALHQVFYSVEGTVRGERFCQLLFFAVADTYCEANNLDLSREANAGRGPVDFKVSSGYRSRINVEVKLSKNSGVVSGFTTQLEAYNAAEQAFHSFFLLIDVGKMGKKLAEIQTIQADARAAGRRVPDLVVVDAVPKNSASKL